MRFRALRNAVRTVSEPSRHGHSHAASMWECPMMCMTFFFAALLSGGCWANTCSAAIAPREAALRTRKSRLETPFRCSLTLGSLSSCSAEGGIDAEAPHMKNHEMGLLYAGRGRAWNLQDVDRKIV